MFFHESIYFQMCAFHVNFQRFDNGLSTHGYWQQWPTEIPPSKNAQSPQNTNSF